MIYIHSFCFAFNKVGPTALNLVQRFLLAVFYFETNKSGEWLSCNAPSPAEPEETCLFQQLIDVNPHKYRSLPSYKWLSGEHECNWGKCFFFFAKCRYRYSQILTYRIFL